MKFASLLIAAALIAPAFAQTPDPAEAPAADAPMKKPMKKQKKMKPAEGSDNMAAPTPMKKGMKMKPMKKDKMMQPADAPAQP